MVPQVPGTYGVDNLMHNLPNERIRTHLFNLQGPGRRWIDPCQLRIQKGYVTELFTFRFFSYPIDLYLNFRFLAVVGALVVRTGFC